MARDEGEEAKHAAEKELLQRIEVLSGAMKAVEICPICLHNIRLGHQIGCALKNLEQARVRR